MTADELAAAVNAGCDYCGVTTGLERYEPSTSMGWGIRCQDAAGCNERELAQTPSEDDDDGWKPTKAALRAIGEL